MQKVVIGEGYHVDRDALTDVGVWMWRRADHLGTADLMVPGRHYCVANITYHSFETKRRLVMKRSAEDDLLGLDQRPKRVKQKAPDRLSRLTDELLLRILSYLSPSQLCELQR